jgi:hypothetical protein
MLTLIDQEIAHLARVMKPSLCGDLGGPILPPEYWRKRLHALLDLHHVTKTQLTSIDALLLQLDALDRALADERRVRHG